MKSIVIIFSTLVVGAFIYMGNQIALLNSEISRLTDIKASLTTEVRQLANKNRKLSAQRNATQQAVRHHRQRIIKRSLSKATRIIAKAGGAMIPLAGITVIAASTAEDIRDLCTDIEEARKIEEMTLQEELPSMSIQQDKTCYEDIGAGILRKGFNLMQQVNEGTKANLSEKRSASLSALSVQ